MLYTLMLDSHGSTEPSGLDREFHTLEGLFDFLFDLSPDGEEIDYFVVHWSDESRFCWDLASLEQLLSSFDPMYFEHFVVFVVEERK